MPQDHTEQQLSDTDQQLRQELMALREALARVYHDTNNPLAIISGNAQYLREVGGMMSLDDDLMQPIRDICEASGRVSEGLRELIEMKDHLGHLLRDAGKQ